MVRVEGVLREFAGWLAVNAPEVLCVADLRRAHTEAAAPVYPAHRRSESMTITVTN
ncbi:hypothetical protein MSIMFI_03259 [Mycobacterium simulans]|uniref:hypothetical protein n=1 Tax=Mycobacterium simulans TaxID=627089 RepID=UPI00174B2E21|nr:hypothetical protein [Mycobacterium simulans]SON61741.1 hypothetical protein MSIMFI_03259 [Mycobacterium simulans]